MHTLALLGTWYGDLGLAVAEATVAAGVWALIVWGWTTVRNRILEDELRSVLTPKTFTSLRDGSHGMIVENPTGHEVTIRRFCITARSPKVPNINFQLEFRSDPEQPGPEPVHRGWIVMPPHTKGTWIMPKPDAEHLKQFLDAVGREGFEVTGFRVTVTYSTVFGTTNIRDIEPINPQLKRSIAGMFETYYAGV